MSFLAEYNQKYIIHARYKGFAPTQRTFTLSKHPVERNLTLKLEPDKCFYISGRIADAETNEPLPNANLYIVSSCTAEPLDMLIDDTGYFKHCLTCPCEYSISCGVAGYTLSEKPMGVLACNDSRIVNFYMEKPKKTPKTKIVKPQIKQVAQRIILDEIHFEYGSDAIVPEQATGLDNIASILLQKPEFNIQISAHTDSRGDSQYNQLLSERRARNAMAYLVSSGIARKRITYVGKGESELRNHCQDDVSCTDQEHRFNRRLEISIIE